MGPALAMAALLAVSAPDGGAPAPSPRPAALRCKGEKPRDKATRQARTTIEGTAFYQLAARQLGAAVSCEVKWTSFEGRRFSEVKYRFERGSALFANQPPESSITTLEADGGFPDEAAVRAFMKSAEPMKSFNLQWGARPEVTEEKGERTETYASPEDSGDNAMADFVTRDGKLVRVSFHYAL